MQIRSYLMAIALPLFSWKAKAQSEFRPFAGIGYGMENRIGFRGIQLSGGVALPFQDHLSGIAQLELFHGGHVDGWNDVMNKGARYMQATASVRLEYSSGSEPGMGFLAHAGLAMRGGSTYHFDHGNIHGGVVTDAYYTTEKIRGNGFVIGLGYGFRISETLGAKLEISDQALLRINDMYTFSCSLIF